MNYAPPGYHYEWVEEPTEGYHAWRLIPAERARSCAMKGCAKDAEAELNRQRIRGLLDYDAWWAYCGDHLYGRRIRAGRIEGRRLVKDEVSRGSIPVVASGSHRVLRD